MDLHCKDGADIGILLNVVYQTVTSSTSKTAVTLIQDDAVMLQKHRLPEMQH